MVKIKRLTSLRPLEASNLVEESKEEGFNFLHRLVTDFNSGKNTFTGRGEALFGVLTDKNELVAIGGLNVDPFAGGARVGRVRRFYVAKPYRRGGIGKLLVNRIIDHASLHFKVLVLHTDTVKADAFYQAIGFEKGCSYQNTTHFMKMGEMVDDEKE